MSKFLCIALVALSFSGCKTIESLVGSTPPTPQQVTADVQIAVGVAALVPNSQGYIANIKAYVQLLASAIQTGQAVLPAPSVIQADLAALATSVGSPAWAINLNTKIVAEYTKIYGKIAGDTVTIEAYLNAVIAGL
jgi:hypothetical protein